MRGKYIKRVNQFLLSREPTDPERWTLLPDCRAEFIAFVLNFLERRGYCASHLTPDDTLRSTLLIDKALPGDWDWDFDEEFRRRFGFSPLREARLDPDMTLEALVRALSIALKAANL
jgi:hypothetical protein